MTEQQWQQDMRHSRYVPASPEAAWQALEELTVRDIRVAQVLLTIRELPARLKRRPQPASDTRLLELADSEQFSVVTDDPPRRLELATVGRFWRLVAEPGPLLSDRAALDAFAEPGWVKVLMYFTFEPEGDGTRVGTGTMVAATDASARRKFAAYWFVIRPFSGLIRHAILAAVDRRVRKPSDITRR